jgi:tetratricopeptide (TPR) repeat protein
MSDKWLIYKGFRMKKAVLLTIALLVLIASQAFSLDISKDITEAYENRNYDEAIIKIEAALKKDKRNYELFFMKGKCHLEKHEFDKAEEALKQSVKIKGNFFEARYALGELYLHNEQLDEAKKTFEEGLKKAKKDVEKALFEDGLGLYYMAMKDNSNADIQFRKAQIADRENLTYVMHQGDNSYEQGIYAVALNAYKKILPKDSLNPELHFRISRCYLMQKQFQSALEEINKTLELDSGYTDAYIMSGNIHTLYAATQTDVDLRNQILAQAIFLYNKYLDMTGDSGIANYYRGKAYFQLNDYQHAVDDFLSSQRLNLEKADLLSLIGKSYSKLKEHQKAIDALNANEESILNDDPNYEWKPEDALLFIERANAYSGLADSASRLMAAEDYDRGLALDSANLMAYYWAALNKYYIKDYAGSLPYYRKHVDLYFETQNAENVGAYLNMAYCFLGMQDWDSTLFYLEKVKAIEPDNIGAYELAAKVCLQKKDYPCVIENYQKVKELDPDNCEPDRWIGLVYLIQESPKPQPSNSIKFLKQYQACLRAQGKSSCDDMEVYEWIAKAYQMKDDVNNAFDWAKKGLKCDPNNSELKKIFEELEFEVD